MIGLLDSAAAWVDGMSDSQAKLVGSLVGIFGGLTALVVGALFNAFLNRRRDERLRLNEKAAVMAALYGEILMLRRSLAEVSRYVALVDAEGEYRQHLRFDEDYLRRCKLPEPTLYLALAPRIGLLDGAMIVNVSRFYARYHEVQKWLPLMVPDENRGYSYSAEHVGRPAVDASLGILPTLREMETRLGLPKAEDQLDFGRMQELLALEDMRREEAD